MKTTETMKSRSLKSLIAALLSVAVIAVSGCGSSTPAQSTTAAQAQTAAQYR